MARLTRSFHLSFTEEDAGVWDRFQARCTAAGISGNHAVKMFVFAVAAGRLDITAPAITGRASRRTPSGMPHQQAASAPVQYPPFKAPGGAS